eukprot:254298-Chlamydomonas_euryale.AAC.2
MQAVGASWPTSRHILLRPGRIPGVICFVVWLPHAPRARFCCRRRDHTCHTRRPCHTQMSDVRSTLLPMRTRLCRKAAMRVSAVAPGASPPTDLTGAKKLAGKWPKCVISLSKKMRCSEGVHSCFVSLRSCIGTAPAAAAAADAQAAATCHF